MASTHGMLPGWPICKGADESGMGPELAGGAGKNILVPCEEIFVMSQDPDYC